MDLLGSLGEQKNNAPPNKCSRKGCSSLATWQILWNNPKIHDPNRRKIWLACPEHRSYLEDFLRARSFWKETVPLGQAQPPLTE